MAIPLSSLGDITKKEKLAWKLDRGTPYVPSPVLYKGIVYFNSSNKAMISAVDAKSGEVHYGRERLPRVGSIYSSPVAANNRIYWTYRDGRTVVVEHGNELKVLATNQLDDGIDSSLALVDGEIFIRGKKNLYCIAEAKNE